MPRHCNCPHTLLFFLPGKKLFEPLFGRFKTIGCLIFVLFKMFYMNWEILNLISNLKYDYFSHRQKDQN